MQPARSIALSAMIATALGIGASPGWSQPTAQQQEAVRSNCRSDFMANCSGVPRGGAEAVQCLERNAAKLSPACRSAVNALAPKPAAPAQATTAPAPAAAPATPAPAASAPEQPSAAPAQPAAAPAAAPPPATPAPSRATAPAAATPPKAPASRPTSQQQAAIRQACQSDFMSRCRGVQPGGQAALACLQRNAARLSAGCKQALSALGAAPAGKPAAAAPAAVAAPPPAAAPAPMGPLPPRVRLGVLRACERDFRSACPNVPPGGGRIIECLARNEAVLSSTCRGAIARARGR
jgi:hypothetical protein